MKIKIKDEDELIGIAEEAIRIIANLRKFTKLWEESFGVELKARKKYYEEQADELIKKLEIMELKKSEEIKIEINENTSGS
jgi:hypothetical protein